MASSFRIDPSTTDFSIYSHIIGNNEFDADMDIVESFVRSYQQPDNVLAQSAVFNYYISRLLSYWDFTMEYATSDQIIMDLKKKKNFQEKTYSMESIQSIDQKIMAYIQTLQSNFMTKPIVNIKAIGRGFQMIGNVACMYDLDKKLGYDFLRGRKVKFSEKYYLLPNTIGLFGLNTYLYALFEGIYLIGAPTRTVYFDLKYGCPADFIVHDIIHSQSIKIPNHQSKIIYYTILNDPNLSSLEKECHITNIWIQIHEQDNSDLYELIYYNVNDLLKNYQRLYSNTGNDFAGLYHIFDGFTRTSALVDFLKQKDQQEIKLQMKLEETQTKGIASETWENEPWNEQDWLLARFPLSYILANLYTIKYIKEILN